VSDLVGELVRDPAEEGPDSVLEPLTPTQYAQKASWYWRVLDTLSTYLPLVLMTVLALGTWWLASNAPGLGDTVAPPVLRHDPDYTMSNFTVQRFSAEGPLKAQIEGTTLRHYPDTDTLEIDDVRIHAMTPDGKITNATAKRALSNSDGSEVQLFGGARVIREPTGTDEGIEFRGEFLHTFLNTERVQSHLPVTLIHGKTEIRGDTMDYDNLDRIVDLKGHVKATFPPAQASVSAKPSK
jgi:lipopolysaccharide export system protein LptC